MKNEKDKKVFLIRFIISYNIHKFTSCHPSYSTKSFTII